MRAIVIAAVLMTVALPAAAQNREAFCGLLAGGDQAAVAGADYVPGVDVQGRPVVPADLNAPVPGLPDVIRIPVTVDLAQGLNQPLPQGMELKADFGVIEIYRNNAVTMNGQDITAQAMALCGKEAPLPPEQQEKPETQTPDLPAPPHALKPVDEEIIWGEGH